MGPLRRGKPKPGLSSQAERGSDSRYAAGASASSPSCETLSRALGRVAAPGWLESRWLELALRSPAPQRVRDESGVLMVGVELEKPAPGICGLGPALVLSPQRSEVVERKQVLRIDLQNGLVFRLALTQPSLKPERVGQVEPRSRVAGIDLGRTAKAPLGLAGRFARRR